MKKILTPIVLPICLVLMIVLLINDYIANGDFKGMQFAIICFLTPAAIKGLKPEYSETNKFIFLSKTFLAIGIIIFVFTILRMMQ